MNLDAASMSADDRFTAQTIVRWRRALWAVAVLLFATPWVAMHVTDEVRWDGLDFLVFAGMLGLAGGLVEIVVRVTRRRLAVLGAVALVGAAFLLVWAELAVGIFP